ncbi:MAG TPA: peptidoglycan DD-metalloendopeptidase family protein [Candidatus Limnocylindria bacterium]|nr:peptidoglycan DD-metalloendopeptidase family protein [Candidatus Limnocylindria bacterium]
MRKVARAGLVCAMVLSFAAPAAAALPSEDETAPAPGPYCLERVPLPELVNVIDAKWSPDARTLALVRFERTPDSGPSGYLEDEQLELLDMRTQKVRSLGSIWYGRPAWSPSGKYLAYWGYRADFLEVMDRATGEVVAKLTPSNPEFRWQGDTLLYIEKSTIRAWKGGRIPETLGRLGDTKVPHFPEDAWQWSGDGTRFTLTRYDYKDPVPERFLGSTASQDADPIDLPGALYTEWAPAGSVLLVRYAAALEVRDVDANTVDRIAIPRNALHSWAADGRTLLVRTPRPTVAAGDAYEEARIVWPKASARPALLPDVFGVRVFSPDGRFFGGTVRTDRHDNVFVAFRCYEIVRVDPKGVPVEFAGRFAKIASTGQLIRPVSGPVAQFFHPAHSGVDFAAPFGTPIVAADAGTVTKTGWQPDGEGGIRVCLQHSGGLETCYYHASTVVVTVGQRVARGEVIAIVGQSGLSTSAHLHWEAKLNGKVIDPLLR